MSRIATLLVATLLILSIFGCSNEGKAPTPSGADMTDSNLGLTPEEQEARDRDNRMMEALRQADEDRGASLQELLPNAVPVSDLQYWAPLPGPGARAKLKQAIQSGADVNGKSAGNYTPLHAAAENGVLENVQLLVAAGADVSAKTVDGRTPLDFAKAQGHADVVAFLESQTR